MDVISVPTQEQHHPLALEVNELYVYCYLCDDYVLNDNATGDLKLLRSTLSAIKSQCYEVTTRSGRTLRSSSTAGDQPSPSTQELQLRDEDRMFTALWHRRRALIGRVFRLWFVQTERGQMRLEEERQQEEEEEKKREARERRRELKRQAREELESTPPRKSRRIRRQSLKAASASTPTSAPARISTPTPRTTKDRKPQHRPRTSTIAKRAQPPPLKTGDSPIKRRPTVTPGVTGLRNLGNTCYMNSILQVLSHLHVFRECFLRLDLNQALELLASALIPAFRGYAQQDAQEFLCELLDKVQRELERTRTLTPTTVPANQRRLIKQVLSVVNTIFHGQLLSQVRCLACDHRSNTIEPFWDLSLEFPERYHSNSKDAAQVQCGLTEMLAKFTETEALEGAIYACDHCNSKQRRFCSKQVVLTEAQKQLMVHKLPHVLRLHLKRFRWSGRNHREKIGVHVQFEQELDMEPYCCKDSSNSLHPQHFLYQLSAVVMHHGKGFGSGHYTAFCYNTEGGFWVHCNDSKLSVCAVEEVCKAQAYILFYTQRNSQDKIKASDL
ncbi:Ubiquitin carboxyl-terminal hydrolase 44 [Triplophysa tibetana]|uniref:Ubiquitin carboxyl-terminal hydrolase n=1 Tax=Triplophysa tibetana TaxID=1572043 RepID=A0A5A9PGY7_9TELE|nr:Ubiquitin carboxyl-terminal hydrolase 44 [Triplophysa tibetana]